jgi:ABC-type sugar transport system permease subunit
MIYSAVIVAYYTLVFIVPFGVAVWLAFHHWDYIVTPRFAGLANFQRFFTDKRFWLALSKTIQFAVVEIGIGVFLMLLLALLVSLLKGRLEGFFLTICYLPQVTPAIVSSYLWRWMYRPRGGVFNTVLQTFGLPPQRFLQDPKQALWCIVAMVIWTFVGAGSVLFLAGIKNIPTSLYDAAEIDGAGVWGMFFKITIPLLRPVLLYQVVVSVISVVQMFVPFFLIGTGRATRTLALYVYELGFSSYDLGFGAAVSLFMFVLLLAATLFQLQRFRTTWEY